MRLSLFALYGLVLLAVTVYAAPVEQHHNAVVETATESPVIRTDIAQDALSQAVRTEEQQFAKRGSHISGRGLASVVQPVLCAFEPLANGISYGLQHGTGHVKDAVQTLGCGLNQVANGLAKVGGGATAGLGKTVCNIPGAILGLASAIKKKGLTEEVLNTLFGTSSY